MIKFTIPVPPQSKQSVRKGVHSFYVDPKKKDYQKLLSFYASREFDLQRAMPIRGVILLRVKFIFSSTKKILRGRYKNTRPDLDNLLKPLKDALSGVFFEDDSQIVSIEATKIYGEVGCIDVELIEL